MLDGALSQVVQHLVAGGMSGTGYFADFIEVVDVEIAHAPGADLAVSREHLECPHRLLERIAAAPMQQIAIQAVRLQARQRLLAREDGAAPRRVARQYLGHEEYLVASPLDRRAHEGFGGPRAVHFGGVDVSQTQVEPAAQGADGLGGVGFVRAPRSLAHDRDRAAPRSKNASDLRVVHQSILCAPKASSSGEFDASISRHLVKPSAMAALGAVTAARPVTTQRASLPW